ncbi:MAG: LuxR C-terminal-related transcriptional regulator [Chloroflexota bacterium]
MQDLLQTKLFIPLMPSGVIPRPHLVEQLNRGLAGKLSLVTAPAGYGKTTLVTTWLHQLDDAQVMWVSLDEGDNDSRRFFTYVAAALCQLDESFVAIKDELMQDPRAELSLPALVTSLLNGLMAYGRRTVLILDDYHEIEEPAIHEALSLWLTHQPPNAHLVITSRTEPPLPLPRMRVRRQVTDIDTESLRFSRAEAADFLNQHMHLNLSANDITQLDSITEGWVASLQLAALSLQNKVDPSAFIQTFKGDNRYIVDYLVNEVLHRQPGYIRDFLLQTSILERLNVQLCNAVTGQVGSQHILETLDQARLFVIPLDDRRHWYRYHHLFADCLQAELRRTTPDAVAAYHERASHWFSEHGLPTEAIQHAFAAENSELAADLIVRNIHKMLWEQGELHRIWRWIQQLPKAVLHSSPHLLTTVVWLYQELFLDHGTHLDTLLDDAETLLAAPDASYSSVEAADVGIQIALARANLARLRGHVAQGIDHCEQAMQLIQADVSPILKTGALHSSALTHHQIGNITQSLTYSAMHFDALRPDQPFDYANHVFLAYRVDALRLHGELQQAQDVVKRFLPTHTQGQHQRHSTGAAMIAVSLAEVLRERNQFTLAIDTLTPAIETLKPQPSMAVVVQTAAITLAHIYQAQGRGTEALQLLAETQQDTQSGTIYSPAARIPATIAYLHLRQGNLAAAKDWVELVGLRADDTPRYMLEIDYLVLARVLMATGDAQSAQTLLDKLKTVATAGGRVARLIEVLILEALTYQTLGEPEKALQQLAQAIQHAQPAGFVRVFVDEGEALVPLLKQLAGRGVAVTYIRQLLPLFEAASSTTLGSLANQPTTTSPIVEPEPDALNLLLNPLTQRELATLRYLATDLTIPEIAEQMVVAPSTVRTYVKRIYGKLDVHTRIEAVNRARALALLG